MATEADVLSRQKEVTDRISTQVRTLAVSFLALVWLFLVPGKDGAPVTPFAVDKGLLLAAGATALLAMVLDFLQYVAGYLSVRHTLKNPVTTQGQQPNYVYDYGLIRYKAQRWMFWGKQVLLAASFVCIAQAFYTALFG